MAPRLRLLKDIWQFVDETKQGYAFFKIHPDRLVLVPEYMQSLETFQYSNWVIADPEWERHWR